MTPEDHPAFNEFVATIAALRAPDGCPWDKEQTHLSIAPNMIEESYEAVDAIEHGNVQHLREELGDVLLQVVLQSQIAADDGEFTIDDVCADVNAKMIRRHPHVFGDAKAESANEVLDVWDKVKLAEQASDDEGGEAAKGLLDSVPTSFPALTQALKISRKAASCGFEWDSLNGVWEKVEEEISELKAAYAEANKDASGKVMRGNADVTRAANTEKSDGTTAANGSGRIEEADAEPASSIEADAVEEELGDVLFSLVNVGRKMGVNPENALRRTCIKFRERWSYMEQTAHMRGERLENMSQTQLEELWQQAKSA